MKKYLSLIASLFLFATCSCGQSGIGGKAALGGTGRTGNTGVFQLVQTPGTFAAFIGASTFTQAYGSPNVAGNLLIAMIHVDVGFGTPTGVTDTQGNTWFQVGISDVSISTIFYCPSARAGANTVNVALSSASNGSVSLAEYSGQLASHPVGTSVTPSGLTQPVTVINTPVPGSLIINLFSTNNNPATWSSISGCIPHTGTAGTTAIWMDNTSSGQGFNTCSVASQTCTGCPDFIAKTVSFLPADYSVLPSPAQVRQVEGSAGSSGLLIIGQSSPATDIFAGGNQAGNFIVCPMAQGPGTVDHVTGVSDTAGNTYSLLPGSGQVADNVNHIFYSFWVAPVLASSFSNNTITVTLSSSTVTFGCAEFSGLAGTFDASAIDNGSYSITAAALHELIITVNAWSGGGPTSWTNLTGREIFPSGNQFMEVNFFLSVSGSNPVTVQIPGGGNFPGSLSAAIR
jgi:hypothetical protein